MGNKQVVFVTVLAVGALMVLVFFAGREVGTFQTRQYIRDLAVHMDKDPEVAQAIIDCAVERVP